MLEAFKTVKNAVSNFMRLFKPQATDTEHGSGINENECETSIAHKKSERYSEHQHVSGTKLLENHSLDLQIRPLSRGEMSQSDQDRLVPTYNISLPADATPIDVPGVNGGRIPMKPPNFSHHGGLNTLGKQNRVSARKNGQVTGYGKNSRNVFAGTNGLDLVSTSGDNVQHRNKRAQFPDDDIMEQPASKRRKSNKHQEVAYTQAMDVDPATDDEASISHAASRKIERINSAQSHTSTASERRQFELQNISQASEFREINQRINARNYRAVSSRPAIPDHDLPPLPRASQIGAVLDEPTEVQQPSIRHKRHGFQAMYMSPDDELCLDPPIAPRGEVSRYFKASAPKNKKRLETVLKNSTGLKRPGSRSSNTSPSQPKQSKKVEEQDRANLKEHHIADMSSGSEDELAHTEAISAPFISSKQALQQRRVSRATNASATNRSTSRILATNGQLGNPLVQGYTQLERMDIPVDHIVWHTGERYEAALLLHPDLKLCGWLVMSSERPEPNVQKNDDVITSIIWDDVHEILLDESCRAELHWHPLAQDKPRIIAIEFQSPDRLQLFQKQVIQFGLRFQRISSSENETSSDYLNPVDKDQEKEYLEVKQELRQQQLTVGAAKRRREIELSSKQPERKPKLVSQLQNGDGGKLQLDLPPSRTRPPLQQTRYFAEPQTPPSVPRTSARTAAVRANRDLKSTGLETDYSKVPKYSEVNGFGPPWPQSVVFPSSGKQRATVDFEDLKRLDEGDLLNDNLIQFGIQWLLQDTTIPENEVYFFSSYFYSTLTKKGRRTIDYDSVSRWTSKINIFNYQYLVIPINEEFHWYLAVIANPGYLFLSPGSESIEDTTDIHAVQLGNPGEGPDKTEEHIGSNGLDLQSKVSLLTLKDEEENSIPDGEWPPSQENGRAVATSPFSGKASGMDVTYQTISQPATPAKDSEGEMVTMKNKRNKKKYVPPLRKYNPERPVIIMLDSLGSPHAAAARSIKEYLVVEGKSKFGRDITIDTISAMNAKGIPQQNNFCDCGLFLLGYVEKFVTDPKAFVTGVLTRNFGSVDYWADLDPSKMRNNIRETLMGLGERVREERLKLKEEKKARKLANLQREITAPVSVVDSGQVPLSSHLSESNAVEDRMTAMDSHHQSSVSSLEATISGAAATTKPLVSAITQQKSTSTPTEALLDHTSPITKAKKSLERTPKNQVVIIDDSPESHFVDVSQRSPRGRVASIATRSTHVPASPLMVTVDNHSSSPEGEAGDPKVMSPAPNHPPASSVAENEVSLGNSRDGTNKTASTKLENSIETLKLRNELERSAPPPESVTNAATEMDTTVGDYKRGRRKSVF